MLVGGQERTGWPVFASEPRLSRLCTTDCFDVGLEAEDGPMARRNRDSNVRLAVTEAILTPATALGIAFSAHHWQHQPWWGAVGAGVTIALVPGAVRWWQYRR